MVYDFLTSPYLLARVAFEMELLREHFFWPMPAYYEANDPTFLADGLLFLWGGTGTVENRPRRPTGGSRPE